MFAASPLSLSTNLASCTLNCKDQYHNLEDLCVIFWSYRSFLCYEFCGFCLYIWLSLVVILILFEMRNPSFTGFKSDEFPVLDDFLPLIWIRQLEDFDLFFTGINISLSFVFLFFYHFFSIILKLGSLSFDKKKYQIPKTFPRKFSARANGTPKKKKKDLHASISNFLFEDKSAVRFFSVLDFFFRTFLVNLNFCCLFVLFMFVLLGHHF